MGRKRQEVIVRNPEPAQEPGAVTQALIPLLRAVVSGVLVSAVLVFGVQVWRGVWLDFPTVGLVWALVTVVAGFVFSPAEKDALVRFYTHVRPFGWWGPIKREAIQRGLLTPGDRTNYYDAANSLLCPIFQVCICLVPFYAFMRLWHPCVISLLVLLGSCIALYFTWYRQLPAKDEQVGGSRESPSIRPERASVTEEILAPQESVSPARPYTSGSLASTNTKRGTDHEKK